ncbi:MAG: 30S ribosomal protein S9 [Candidatus Njordarchaeales archaeon]
MSEEAGNVVSTESETKQEIEIPRPEVSRQRKIVLAAGKRKTAIARAVIMPGTGIVRINGRRLEAIENPWVRAIIEEPLLLIGPLRNKINIKVRVHGGGVSGQAQAARIAIARAIVRYFNDPRIEELFKQYDRYMLVGDPRRKEMKKFGGPGARARFQTSYR